MRKAFFTPLVLAGALLLAGTGCATSKGDAAASPEADTAAFPEPVTVTNCGQDITVEAAPQRIVSMNDHVTEVLLELGLGDRIVGMGYGDATPLPEYADQWEKIPALAAEYPTMEQLLDVDPDLVVGGMSSAFNEKEGRSRDAFAQHEIDIFLFTEYCSEEAFSLDMLATDYTQLGQLTGTEPAAEELVADVRGDMTEIADQVGGAEPVPTFAYDSGEKEVLTVGGVGIGHLIVENAGGENLFADGARPYSKTTWEQVAERAPEAIVVLDYGDSTAEQKIQVLKDQPLMQTTPAVQNDRFVVVPLDDFFESPRMIGSSRTVAEFLHPDLMA